MILETNYAAPCYWGEFPLSFAVCLGLDDAVTWLLHRGASPLAVDLNGNNILHMLVLHNKLVSTEKISPIKCDPKVSPYSKGFGK